MRIGEEPLSQVVHFIGATAEASEPLGRRHEHRYRASAAITICPHGAVRPVSRTVSLVSLSAGGLAIIDTMSISAGSRFVAYLPLAEGKTEAVLCEARQSRLNSGGGFRIGASFCGDEQARRFIRGADGVVDADRVSSPLANQPALLHSAAGRFEAVIRNVSETTFELLCKDEFPLGEHVRVESRISGKTMTWRTAVASVMPESENTYVVRLTIINPSDPAVAPAGGFWRKLFART